MVSIFRRLGWRLMLVILVAVGLLALGIILLVGRIAGYGGFVDTLRGADAWWLALCPIGEVIAYFGYILVFRSVAALRGGPVLGLWTTTRVVLAAEGATRMLSPAGAGGIGVFFWVLRRAGMGRREAIVRVLALNILIFGLFAVGTFAAALAIELGASGQVPSAMTIPWLAAVPACLLAALLLTFVPKRELHVPPARGRLRRALADAVAALVTVGRMAARPREHRRALAGNALYWFGDALALWAGLRAFDVDLGIAAVVLAFSTGYLAVALPLPTGAVGGVDAAMTAALYWVGVPLAPALLAVFAYRFFNFLAPTLPGLVALSTLPQLGRELQAASGQGGSASAGNAF